MVGAEGGGELKSFLSAEFHQIVLAKNKHKPEQQIDNNPTQQKPGWVHSAVTFTGRIRVGTTRILRLRPGQISVSGGHFCRWMAANQRAVRLMFRIWLHQQTTNRTVLNTLECDGQDVHPSKLCLCSLNVFY